jgi:hypothetical protein
VVVGIVCTILMLLHTSTRTLIIAPISVILLSVAWSPSVQKYLAEGEKEINTDVCMHLFILKQKVIYNVFSIKSLLSYAIQIEEQTE